MTVHTTHTLTDGTTIALVSQHRSIPATDIPGIHYSILIGYTGRYIAHRITGEPVYTSQGCIGCDIYEDDARAVWAQMCQATDIDTAEQIGRDYWQTHLEMRINSPSRIRDRQRLIGRSL